MKIETIYNIGDEVYTLSNNKIVKAKVVKPFLMGDYEDNDALEKRLGWVLNEQEYNSLLSKHAIRRYEYELFKTIDELIQNLRDTYKK